jgi:hypothetical protein
MDRITHQSPTQRGYGSNLGTIHEAHAEAQERKGGIKPRSKAHRLWRTVRPGGADRPHWPRGPSGLLPRTVRANTADCLALRREPSDKAHRTNRSDPRKTDRPRRPGGPSAWVPERPLLKLGPSANQLQQKPKAKPNQKQRHARTRRTRDEHATCEHATNTQEHDEHATNTQPANTISQTVEAVETRIWGLEKRHTRML